MTEVDDQIAKRTGFAMLWPLVIGLPTALFAGGIDVQVFMVVAALWLAVAIFLIIGPENVSEISFGKTSIKRDVRAPRAAREEVELIRDQMRKISAVSVENTYIISGELLLLIKRLGGLQDVENIKSSPGMQRLIRNMNDVWKFVEPDELKAEHLRKQFRKEIGMPD